MARAWRSCRTVRTDPLLTVGTIGGQALALSPDQPVVVDGREYTFLGKREFAGITVRRDPGSTLIWVATGLFLLGLALTFYTPRRRLWGKIAGGSGARSGVSAASGNAWRRKFGR